MLFLIYVSGFQLDYYTTALSFVQHISFDWEKHVFPVGNYTHNGFTPVTICYG